MDRIDSYVSKLKAILTTLDTASVVGYCFTDSFKRANDVASCAILMSPARQHAFLLSLLLATPEPEAPTSCSDVIWQKIVSILNELYMSYAGFYLLSKKELQQASNQDRQARERMLGPFMHYFNTSLMADPDQVKKHIDDYLSSFRKDVKQVVGIAPDEALDMCEWLSQETERNLNRLIEIRDNHQVKMDQVLSIFESDLDQAMSSGQASEYMFEICNIFSNIGVLDLVDLKTRFPDMAEPYLKAYGVQRGQGPALNYPTEECIYDKQPLIIIGENKAMFASVNALFLAVLRTSEDKIRESKSKLAYERSRDKVLESQVEIAFSNLFNKSATIYTSACETQTGQKEHDLVIISQKNVYIVECKATSPMEPFRDPLKAEERVRSRFKSKKGIQKAYEQSASIPRQVTDGGDVNLYDQKGNFLIKLDSSYDFYSICITRDNYGSIASDLSKFLEKTPSESFPWVANIYDLECFVKAWIYLDLNESDFIRFLKERAKLHGVVHAGDELEYVGYFLAHSDFSFILRNLNAQSMFYIDPTYSDFFDDLYRYESLGGEPPTLVQAHPEIFSSNTRDSSQSLKAQLPQEPSRNQRCPCGSGLRYKRCCGGEKYLKKRRKKVRNTFRR